jgi:hypothetical protein
MCTDPSPSNFIVDVRADTGAFDRWRSEGLDPQTAVKDITIMTKEVSRLTDEMENSRDQKERHHREAMNAAREERIKRYKNEISSVAFDPSIVFQCIGVAIFSKLFFLGMFPSWPSVCSTCSPSWLFGTDMTCMKSCASQLVLTVAPWILIMCYLWNSDIAKCIYAVLLAFSSSLVDWWSYAWLAITMAFTVLVMNLVLIILLTKHLAAKEKGMGRKEAEELYGWWSRWSSLCIWVPRGLAIIVGYGFSF